MATDSTELTFVRCPSCRSLVPAMSTRCRMCGATLDVAGKEDQRANDPQKQARVRQRTMSGGDDPLPISLDDVRETKAPDTKGHAAGNNVAAKEKPIPLDDPLRDFLEEVPVEDTPPPAPKVEAAPPKKAPADESKVIIESGKSPGKGEGLSFSRPASPPPAPPKQSAPPPPPQREERDRGREDRGREDRRDSGKQQREQHREVSREASREAREDRPASQPPRQERQAEQPPKKPAQQPARAAAQHSMPAQSGRLFGWFVSYADPNGSAIEIREGKFFVSRERLKPHDFVVDDDSVSTPHAVVVADVTTGLHIQDLMSDQGIFVRRRGENEFEKHEDRVTVAHGDSVRFGEVEFLLSLVAHVGMK